MLLALASSPVLAASPACSVVAKVAPVSQNVLEGDVVTLNANPSTPSGISYLWSQVSGPSVTLNNVTVVKPTFTAPAVTSAGATIVLAMKVTGCSPALSATTTTTINVGDIAPQNYPPSAAATVSPAPAFEGDVVTLDGTASADPDGDALSHSWTQIGGDPVVLSNANTAVASFTAPNTAYPGGASFSFRLTVSDGVLSATTDKIANVVWVDDPPTAALSCPASINEGATLVLDGSGSTDTDDGIASYSWIQLLGPPNIDMTGFHGDSASFTAPQLSSAQTGEVQFKLTVADVTGQISAADCTVMILDVTPPTFTGDANFSIEATGPTGAIGTFDVQAHDNVDPDSPADCLPPSGSLFALGANTVDCSADDSAGNTGYTSFTLTVVDTTPPTIDGHDDLTEEATSPAGAVVAYTAAATNDLVDGVGVAICVPASGSQFALGETTVDCSASDAAGNVATATSFKVTVSDTIAPAITPPANVVAEATGPFTVVAHGVATATDAVGPITYDDDAPASFPVGETTITWKATDGAMNSSTATSTVTVTDTTAPVIDFHADVNAIATSASGAVVTYTLPAASDLVDGNVAVTCTPVSGSAFAIGSNTVSCSATDAHNNTGTSSFKVIVSYAFNGFFRPIDNLPVINVTKAGSAVPVKFSLGGNMGLAIMAAGYPRSVAMACNGSVSDTVEETVTAGGSSLSYDATTGQYIYVWKSEKAWSGTCRQLQVMLQDGSEHLANFSFTR